ncbi:WhiB family transcriptional regulator [Kitasatospora sp. A2-31]|uniref:WhiB family transcriptional regulator n=1 Tax=Kitasatospora sp. A2-31 TaxID=2916414 RepID=UPI001EECB2C4|nr:WhiB family transcriptional regulator [Kitasatospora sp. A2-31]MCG6497622.1 WhiB family transcriptional regulator [Kitasatospora sp. A2-31]
MPKNVSSSPERGEPAAPCKRPDVDPDLFFPETDGSNFRRPTASERIALNLCAQCPIAQRAACLADALNYPLDAQYGVVGGATASQRQAILRGRQVALQLGAAA